MRLKGTVRKSWI